jgi:hypothetical protein
VSASPPPNPPQAEHRWPAWIQPPRDVVPAIVPAERVLAHTPQRAVGLTGIRAYPNGFGFTLHLRLRELVPGEQTTFGIIDGPTDPSGEFAAYYFRVGVGFADGRKATNLDGGHWSFDEAERPPPVLSSIRCQGHNSHDLDLGFWVWGLPPPGPLAFVCEWSARQIPESRVEIDAALVLEAAGRAQTIWPGEAPP